MEVLIFFRRIHQLGESRVQAGVTEHRQFLGEGFVERSGLRVLVVDIFFSLNCVKETAFVTFLHDVKHQ